MVRTTNDSTHFILRSSTSYCNDRRHFDRLLERLGLKWNPEVIAAGVVAYRATSPVYLTPFPDTVPTLLRFKDSGAPPMR